MNRNQIIAALVVLLVIGSVWGTLMDKKSSRFERELKATTNQLEKLQVASGEKQEILGQTGQQMSRLEEKKALLQKNLDIQKTDAANLRSDFESLSKSVAGKDQQLSTLTSQVAELKTTLEQKDRELTAAEEREKKLHADLENSTSQNNQFQESLSNTDDQIRSLKETIDVTRKELDLAKDEVAKSRMTGFAMRNLEKNNAELQASLDEKNQALKEAKMEQERTQTNMEVLLAEISAQKGKIAAQEKKIRDLEKSATAK